MAWLTGRQLEADITRSFLSSLVGVDANVAIVFRRFRQAPFGIGKPSEEVQDRRHKDTAKRQEHGCQAKLSVVVHPAVTTAATFKLPVLARNIKQEAE